MQASVHSWIAGIWIVVAIYWGFSALHTKPPASVQSLKSGLAQVALPLAAFLLMSDRRLGFGPLSWRFLPESDAGELLGLALTIAGLAFTVWARIALGRNWSAIVMIKDEHDLVRRGPYAIVRHPIYSGVLVAFAGAAIAIGEARALVAFAILATALAFKIRTEEAFMQQQFGEQYDEYRRNVKALIPGVF